MNDKQSQMDAMWDALENGTADERAEAKAVAAFESEPCRCGGTGYLDASDVSDAVYQAALKSGDAFAKVGAIICPSDRCGL